jgi:hypothetical protein
MIEVFDVTWSDLTLSALKAFLADADEESVTWEAKADDQKRPLHSGSIRKAACGFANQIGGFLIIGARRGDDGRWQLPGIKRPDREPELWIGKLLRALSPTPGFDTKAWTVDDDRLVLVVRVQPVAAPPCMTPDGRVYERVSGETLPVEDPALLDRLFQRGRHARDRAEQHAFAAAVRGLDAPRWTDELAAGLSVTLAPVARSSDDIASRLFVPSFRKQARLALRGVLGEHREPSDIETWVQQDAFSLLAQFRDFSVMHGSVSNRGRPWKSTWIVQATWDAAVTVSASFAPSELEDLDPVEELLVPGWREAALLVGLLGGYGPAHLGVGVRASPPSRGRPLPPPAPPAGSMFRGLPAETQIGRWVDVAPPDRAVVDSIARELTRAAGRTADEPGRSAEARPGD